MFARRIKAKKMVMTSASRVVGLEGCTQSKKERMRGIEEKERKRGA